MFHSTSISPSFSLLIILPLFDFYTCSSQKYSNIPTTRDIPYLGNALHEGLIYLKNCSDTKTLDVALGIVLVKGSLQWIRNRLKQGTNYGVKFTVKLSRLFKLCESLFSEIHQIFKVSENLRERKFAELLGFIFYDIIAEDLKYDSLIKTSIGVLNLENCSYISNYILKGTPDDSDFCILELFDKSCKISSYCWFQETNNLNNAGYKTSHRLLYLQLLMKLKCGEGDERRVEAMKVSMCQRMLEEANSLYGKHAFFARDLFLEQIALCGFDGHVEFAERDWSIQIPRWQHSEGCFGILRGEPFPEESCSGWRSDLNARRDDPCSKHLTAVAIAAIAFHLRVAFDQL